MTRNPYLPPTTDVDPPADAPAMGEPNPGAYVPGGGRAKAAIGLMIATMVVDAGSVATGINQSLVVADMAAGSPVSPARIEMNDALYGIGGIFQLLALIGAAIAFCMWFYRAYANLLPLGAGPLSHAAGWAPGSFFVPFLNLVRPYQIAKETWHGSMPGSPAALGGHGPIVLWWSLFLGSNFIANIGSRMLTRASTPSSIQSATIVLLVADVMSIAAAVATIRMIRGVEARQLARAGELGAGAPAAAVPH